MTSARSTGEDSGHDLDRMTELVFRLPAELRNEIYALCLPDNFERAISDERILEVRWLGCSEQLFLEAATLVYSVIPFYCSTGLPLGVGDATYRMSGDIRCRPHLLDSHSLVGDFERHVRATYGKGRARSLEFLASRMVKELVVEVRVADCERAPDLADRFATFFDGLRERFGGLKKLSILFGPAFMAVTAEMASIKAMSRTGWVDIRGTPGEPYLQNAIASVKLLAPTTCKVQWKVSGAFNVFDSGPVLSRAPRKVRQRKYEPLPAESPIKATWTRVLLLYPGDQSQPLECDLEVVNVISDQCPPYEALSYVWGPKEPRGSITCHNSGQGEQAERSDVEIGPNLEHALKALRSKTTARLIWVDALCISQTDLDEGARQVTYMRQIYKHASLVTVWLGVPTFDDNAFFVGVQCLCEERKKWAQDELNNHDMYPGWGDVFVEKMTHNSLEMHPSIRADLIKLFYNDYFRRVWCVQEIVAARHCVAQYGDKAIDMYELLPLLKHAVTLSYSLAPNHLNVWRHVDTSWSHKASGSPDQDCSLGPMLHVLTTLRESDSTDPRDRIFAALGICDEGMGSILDDNFSRLPRVTVAQRWLFGLLEWLDFDAPNRFRRLALKPDYTKTTMEVYRDFTRYTALELPRGLSVLSYPQHTPDTLRDKWPSWVPHSDARRRMSFFKGDLYDAGIKNYIPFIHHSEMIDAPLKQPPQEPDVLQLSGFRIDTVAQIADPIELPSSEGLHLAVEKPWKSLFDDQLFPRPGIQYDHHEERLDIAYLLTLCMGAHWEVFSGTGRSSLPFGTSIAATPLPPFMIQPKPDCCDGL
ncbi:hypothetical protein LTS10_007303 [Elasticomyces elasticus]|nr:hypothetical protein LTS10_007303 [Elasticomyces elasticus]